MQVATLVTGYVKNCFWFNSLETEVFLKTYQHLEKKSEEFPFVSIQVFFSIQTTHVPSVAAKPGETAPAELIEKSVFHSGAIWSQIKLIEYNTVREHEEKPECFSCVLIHHFCLWKLIEFWLFGDSLGLLLRYNLKNNSIIQTHQSGCGPSQL